jgi:hypothetical protein
MFIANPNYRIPFTGSNTVLTRNRLANKWHKARPTPSAEDIRLHAWLNERLAVLQYERSGLWPRLRRLLFGNRLAQLLRR